MLKYPDLKRIRQLANTYDFATVVNETIGNFINVKVLPHTCVVASSLTKIFSGKCNAMGGSAMFNPRGRHYQSLKRVADAEYEDNYWAEGIIFMERNSRHFVSRIKSNNTKVICNSFEHIL
jgi:cystathionine gamma-synthase